MKKIIALSALSLAFASSAFAGSSYVTGNIQIHDDGRIHGSDMTSTLEAGHTFDNSLGGFTVYSEFDGIQLGELEGLTSAETGGAQQQVTILLVSLSVVSNLSTLLTSYGLLLVTNTYSLRVRAFSSVH